MSNLQNSGLSRGNNIASDIKIAGFVINSFVDWPAKIASVIFLGGCNFTCPHCHNHKIMCGTSNTIPLDEVLCDIKEQIGFIDGVVLSGGEPTVHPKLREIILKIRELGLPIKLDTHGGNFEMLKSLVDEKLVDFVAMDIKAPLEKYIELGFVGGKSLPPAGCSLYERESVLVENVKKSLEFLKSGAVEHMFRTTPIPELTQEDIAECQRLAGQSTWQKNHFIKQE